MSSRIEHYLKLLLENPDKWVRVTKRKNQASKETSLRERQEVIRDLKTSLDLMNIRYDRYQSKFRVWSDKAIEEEKASQHSISIVVDYATELRELAIKSPEMLGTLNYGRQSGKSTLIKELIKFKEYRALEDDRPDSTLPSIHRPPTKD